MFRHVRCVFCTRLAQWPRRMVTVAPGSIHNSSPEHLIGKVALCQWISHTTDTLEIYHEKVRWVALPYQNIQKQKLENRKLWIRPARAGAPKFRQQTGRRRHQQLIWSKVGQKLWVFVGFFCLIFCRATPGGRGSLLRMTLQERRLASFFPLYSGYIFRCYGEAQSCGLGAS